MDPFSARCSRVESIDPDNPQLLRDLSHSMLVFDDPYPIDGVLLGEQTLDKILETTEQTLEPEWKKMFRRVRKFAREHQALPRYSQKTELLEKELGKWCYQQCCKKHELSETQQVMLQTINGWSWKVHGNYDSWYEKYYAVLGFVGQHGRLPIQKRMDIVGEHKLALWCNNQRNRKGLLSISQIEQLEQIPGWYWKKKRTCNEVMRPRKRSKKPRMSKPTKIVLMESDIIQQEPLPMVDMPLYPVDMPTQRCQHIKRSVVWLR